MFNHLKVILPAVPLYQPERSMSRAVKEWFHKGLWVHNPNPVHFILTYSRVTTLHMAWQQSWCNRSKVRAEHIITIKITAKYILTKFELWDNFLLNCPIIFPVQFQFDRHISETFCCSKYSSRGGGGGGGGGQSSHILGAGEDGWVLTQSSGYVFVNVPECFSAWSFSFS